MNFIGVKSKPLGLGCWPIGGEMYSADGQSLGYTNVDDKESIRAIQTAIDHGITIFDTAAAYGTGHSERLLARTLQHRTDVTIITKIGLAIDESKKILLGEDSEPASVMPAIEACLRRLNRERIDLLLLHINDLAVQQAERLFDVMDLACEQGKIRAYGWSTDFIGSVQAVAQRENFVAVEHAMHVLMDAPAMQTTVQRNQLIALIRSPLAMGLLTGKYRLSDQLPQDDIRAGNQGWVQYYIDGKPNPNFIERLDQLRESLQVGGRTLVQGALGWLWAKSGENLAIPGARTAQQVEELAKALEFGALTQEQMREIDAITGQQWQADGFSAR